MMTLLNVRVVIILHSVLKSNTKWGYRIFWLSDKGYFG